MEIKNNFDLIKEFGLEKLSEEEKVVLQEKILGLVDVRFNRAVFKLLSEQDKTELDGLLEGDDSEAVSRFIADKVPNYAEIHQMVVDDLKEEMLSMKEGVFNKV